MDQVGSLNEMSRYNNKNLAIEPVYGAFKLSEFMLKETHTLQFRFLPFLKYDPKI
jgi:hypothetical protein